MKNSLILIFGITGDLSKRKLIPGLYRLLKSGKLGEAQVIGAAIGERTKFEVLDAAKPFIIDFDFETWQQLVERFTYCPVDINQAVDFDGLAQTIITIRKKHNLADQTLVYCAIFEQLYLKLTQQLVRAGIVRRLDNSSESWCRVVYEKPFGHSYDSVQALNQALLFDINESQIYRVDHYLAKEIVENIVFLRFTNRIFEPLWNYHHIEHIQITLDEALDIEGRGAYYERYGVIKDMVQNHILQLVALLAMDIPRSLSWSDIADAKANILKSVVCEDGLLGQYLGYLKESGVGANSQTPTFAALRLQINDDRWQGVPFYVRTGKVLPAKKSSIVIKFRDTNCLLPKNCPVDSNYLTISIYPEGGFDLEVNAKKPGVNDEVMPIKMRSHYNSLFVPQAPTAYEYVLGEIMSGESSFAVRMDEIEAAWQVADQIAALGLPLHIYQRGTAGPVECQQFEQKYNLIWK